jgi:hypothetical protein
MSDRKAPRLLRILLSMWISCNTANISERLCCQGTACDRSCWYSLVAPLAAAAVIAWPCCLRLMYSRMFQLQVCCCFSAYQQIYVPSAAPPCCLCWCLLLFCCWPCTHLGGCCCSSLPLLLVADCGGACLWGCWCLLLLPAVPSP